ncbi:MAG TPA: DUF2062 domain-containing protein [Steroidobacteraceae bacterium]|jgi:uncharacterized protein (DUF2062 family)|nr:DUF2062 domain-containing protein [Steroidobacteraceae bacterium]
MRDFLQRRLVTPLLALLRQGVTPRELALTLSLGSAIGLIPVLGVSTALCALAAVFLKLNMPAIQLVNYLLMPVQLLLIIPLLRFGELLTNAPRFPITLESGLALLSHGVIDAVQILATAIVHATLGWIVLAPLLAFALFRVLEPVLRHLNNKRRESR